MGHLSGKHVYLSLQQRLDRMPIGAPLHKALIELLQVLYSEEECQVAAAMPLRLTTLERVANIAKMSPDRTRKILETLAWKGLVADIVRDGKPTLYYLNPTVVGFFEYTMMRVREDIDQKRAAELIWAYLREDPEHGFFRMVSAGDTFIARPLVNEEALTPEVYSEVLDWEKASQLIEEAEAWAESICHCRHVKLHLGKRCDYPLEHCLSLNRGATYLVRHDLAKPIDRGRALEILAYARANGAVQMADNVRNQPGFICNCCKCCCELMEGLRTLPDGAKVVTSNYLATSNQLECTGCGKCAEACPVDAVDLVAAQPTEKVPKRKKMAAIDSDLCLGCGVCFTACKFDSVALEPIGQRVLAPETSVERMALQALERGTLQNLLFNDPSRLTHRTLGAIFKALLNLPPAKQLLARRQLKSRFVDALLARMKKKKKQ
jgi:ferredoxin